jgi:hypothetical protein
MHENQEEQWRPIPEVGEGVCYEVSSLGNVRSVDRIVNGSVVEGVRIVNREMTTTGYYRVNISDGNGKRKKLRVHRLVASAFVQNPDGLPQVNHINGNKLDNRADNLEWVTAKQNTRHSIRSGLQRTTLNDWQVRVIRRLSWYMTPQEISEIFQISSTFVRDILFGRCMVLQRDLADGK